MGEFPADFLFGAATASHQVEGDNRNNDWWEYEQAGLMRRSLGSSAAEDWREPSTAVAADRCVATGHSVWARGRTESLGR